MGGVGRDVADLIGVMKASQSCAVSDDPPNFVEVAEAGAIPPGDYRVVTVGEQEIIVANVGGEFSAFENRCSHLALPLAGGRLMKGTITCPHHSAQFDVRTGKCVGFPLVRSIKTFGVCVRDGMVFVSRSPSPS